MTGTALNVVSFLFLGFFLGMQHATDADPVVAIATIVSQSLRFHPDGLEFAPPQRAHGLVGHGRAPVFG